MVKTESNHTCTHYRLNDNTYTPQISILHSSCTTRCCTCTSGRQTRGLLIRPCSTQCISSTTVLSWQSLLQHTVKVETTTGTTARNTTCGVRTMRGLQHSGEPLRSGSNTSRLVLWLRTSSVNTSTARSTASTISNGTTRATQMSRNQIHCSEQIWHCGNATYSNTCRMIMSASRA